MSKELRDYVKNQIVVFDIDGVLATYEFGDKCHYAEKWDEEVFVSVDDNPYRKVNPVPVFQKYINEMDKKNAYVCSVAEDYERECKLDFVTRNYGIPKENIIFVYSKPDKLAELKKLITDDKKVVMVDDTVKTLDGMYGTEGIVTVHVSSFFD